jgi:cell division protein FtsB
VAITLRVPRLAAGPRMPPRDRSLLAVVAVVVALLSLRFLLAGDGYPALQRKRGEIRRLGSEVAALEAENQRLDASIRSLSGDLSAVEKLVREELDFAAAGEVVYIFPAELPPPAGPRLDGPAPAPPRQ